MFTDLILSKETIELGYSKIYNIKLIKPKTIKDLSRIQKSKDLVIVEGGKLNREILENRNVDILVSPEREEGRDSFHQRHSGLNQVLCKIAKKNRIAIAFNFNDILNAKNKHRILGKMMQNIRLCRKYKVDMIIASFAREKYEMRNPNDLISFFVCLGMNQGEAKNALMKSKDMLERKKNLIIEGIELIE